MRLHPAIATNYYIFLDLYKGPNKNIVTNAAAVEINRPHNGNIVAKSDILDSYG